MPGPGVPMAGEEAGRQGGASAAASVRGALLREAIWPVAGALLLLLSLALTVRASIEANGGHLVYALDDPYIHMSIAKNLVSSGVWGVTPGEFAGASSSPGYTALLAAVFAVTGPADAVPLVVNVIAALALYFAVVRLMRRYGYTGSTSMALALAIMFLTPVKALVMGGMEHVLQALLSLLIVVYASRVLTQAGTRRREWARLALLAIMLPIVRYEGIAAILVLSALFAIRKRWGGAILIATAGVMPIVMYGAISRARGGYFLPNSVLVKAGGSFAAPLLQAAAAHTLAPATFMPLLQQGWWTVTAEGGAYFLLPLVASIALIAHALQRSRRFWHPGMVFAATTTAVAAAHLLFGSFGWFYRYEAYAVTLLYCSLAIILATPIRRLLSRHSAPSASRPLRLALSFALAAVVLVPSVNRAVRAEATTVDATHKVYLQHYQTARFLEEYLPGVPVLAHDIGTITYYADAPVLDLAGLGSTQITRARLERADAGVVLDLARTAGVRAAIGYDDILTYELSSGWTKVGAWTVAESVHGEPTVSVYAVDPDPAFAEQLRSAMRDFAGSVPPGVMTAVAQ